MLKAPIMAKITVKMSNADFAILVAPVILEFNPATIVAEPVR